ncbi:IS1 family transposase [Leminorella richardii]|uniref:IS1 family transposase n=1 Tax=Leminorella richardii TaxID=158841 RepID=UPI0014729B50
MIIRKRPKCPFCSSAAHVKKFGKSRSGLQRYRCNSCEKTFQDKYIYDAYKR